MKAIKISFLLIALTIGAMINAQSASDILSSKDYYQSEADYIKYFRLDYGINSSDLISKLPITDQMESQYNGGNAYYYPHPVCTARRHSNCNMVLYRRPPEPSPWIKTEHNDNSNNSTK